MATDPTTSPESLISWAEAGVPPPGSDPRASMVYVVAALAVLAPIPRTKAISRARHPTTVAPTAAIILGWVATLSGVIDCLIPIIFPLCSTGCRARTLPPQARNSNPFLASGRDHRQRLR